MALQKSYKIKWKKKDYITLGKAVSNFNKKIRELNKEEQKMYLPEIQNYQEVKENITTRNELKRVINSLKRFQIEGSEKLVTLSSGQDITKWEYKELKRQRTIAQKRLREEYKTLTIPNKQGFSRVQMGSEEARKIESTLKSIEKLEEQKGYDFERIARRIKIVGTSDYTLKKAYVYQENFLNSLEELVESDKTFKPILDYFKNIKNPITFFNKMQQSSALQDFFEWYKNPENYADFKTTNDLVEYILNEYK